MGDHKLSATDGPWVRHSCNVVGTQIGCGLMFGGRDVSKEINATTTSPEGSVFDNQSILIGPYNNYVVCTMHPQVKRKRRFTKKRDVNRYS